jgi:hypothetical protein
MAPGRVLDALPATVELPLNTYLEVWVMELWSATVPVTAGSLNYAAHPETGGLSQRA